jgi:serine/threonine protein kinase
MGTPDIDDWIEVESLPCYLPFTAQKAKDLRAVLAARKLDRRGNGDINPEFINLVVRMLQLNPSKRISAQEALV